MGVFHLPLAKSTMEVIAILVACIFAAASAFNPSCAPVAHRPWLASSQCQYRAAGISMGNSPVVTDNQGGDREDDPFVPTRDPEPTVIDPNDPKGKQKAIFEAPSFEEYMKQRK